MTIQDAKVGSKEWREMSIEAKFPDHVSPTFKPLADPSRLWGITAQSRDYLRANHRRLVEDLLRIFLSMKTAPPFLWGPPGARKTRTIEAMIRERDENGVPYQVISLQPSTSDPTIIHGIKYTTLDPESGKTIMEQSIPDVAMQITNYWNDYHGLTILFMDEMTTCMPAQQNALLGTLTHGRYGGVDISHLISIVMAGNPENTVSIVHPISEAVINRGAHLPWYGDVELFLEDWRSGWKGSIEPPKDILNWYMSSLMLEQPNKVFRSKEDAWDTDNLVPYELFENSERSMTEWNKAIGVVMDIFDSPEVNQIFDGYPNPQIKRDIRQHYLVEITKAILGPKWSESMEIVVAKENDLPSADLLVDRIKAANIKKDCTSEVLRNSLPSFLTLDGQNNYLGLDQVQAIAIELVSRIRKSAESKSEFLESEFITLWAMIQLASPDDKSILHSHLVTVMVIGMKLLRMGAVEKEAVKSPDFVDPGIKAEISQALKRYVLEIQNS